jgi:hypothetical protein
MMPPYPLTTLTGARAFAHDFLSFLTQQFNETGSLGAFLVLLMTRNPDTGLLLPNSPVPTPVSALSVQADPDTGRPVMGADPFCSSESKAAFSLGIRQLVARSDSVGILFAHEAWMVTATPGESVDTSVAPSAHPQRQEVVLLSLQHQSGSAMWQAPVLRNMPDDGHPSLGAFTEIPLHGRKGEGQFWNLLPPQSHQYN